MATQEFPPSYDAKYDRRDPLAEINRSNLLVLLLDVPAKELTAWEQGFIAAQTMMESSVDAKLAEIVERVV